jgi:UDP-N-acetyl-D-mannosaminuronate dehydrogenase
MLNFRSPVHADGLVGGKCIKMYPYFFHNPKRKSKLSITVHCLIEFVKYLHGGF